MIPKKIHWCWLSGEDIPPFLKSCMATWKKVLPDYEIKLWTRKDFDTTSVDFVKWACDAGKWATASDYVRCYALYNEGGIYLDSDVRVIKSFDPCLKYDFFSALEIHKKYWDGVDFCNLLDGNKQRIDKTILDVPGIGIQAAIFGAAKGHPLLKDIMEIIQTLDFRNNDGSFSVKVTAPSFFAIAAEKYGFRYEDKEQDLNENIHIYNSKVLPWDINDVCSDTIAIHCGMGSWVDNKSKWKQLMSHLKQYKLTNMLYELVKYKGKV